MKPSPFRSNPAVGQEILCCWTRFVSEVHTYIVYTKRFLFSQSRETETSRPAFLQEEESKYSAENSVSGEPHPFCVRQLNRLDGRAQDTLWYCHIWIKLGTAGGICSHSADYEVSFKKVVVGEVIDK